ncbi:MAG: DNA double-strand break repair nuclease NurA [Chloroflexota bacterium]
MLVAQRVADALEAKHEEFRAAAARSRLLQEQYADTLKAVERLTDDELNGLLAQEEWPGARPTAELFERGLVIPFTRRWATAQDARTWALHQLRGVTTVAVDGSQIAASKEFAVPVSLVQVAWFKNPHDPESAYVKDVQNEVITSNEDEGEVDNYAFAESRLNQRRFTLEMEVAADQMRRLETAPPPVVFIDGSLVLSFIHRMVPAAQSGYLHALFQLLDTSEEQGVPVAGFIDLSYARDLTGMLKTAFNLPDGNVFDAALLSERMQPLDRTAAFVTARGDVLPHYRSPRKDWSTEICFVYVKTGADRLPARIDFPRWMLRQGVLDHVLDIIRAEVVVGSGYPYALETADAAAVLTTEDRLQFYRLFHRFAEDTGLDILLPGKSVSKGHRR